MSVTAEIADRIRDLKFNRGYSKLRISQDLGVSRRQVDNVIQATLSPGVAPFDEEDACEPAKPDPVEKERQKVAERAGKEDYVKSVKELGFRGFIADLIRESVDVFEPRPKLRPSLGKTPDKTHVRYPILALSDLHFEEIVRSEAVLGLNSYDIPTACRRLYRVIHAAIDWKRNYEAGGKFRLPELVVALNGDLVSGVLHGLEKHSSAPNIIRATLACGRLVAMALADLADEFGKVRVYGTVGNHGRLPDDKKMSSKDPSRNFDYIVYSTAKELLRGYDNVEFNIPDSYGVIYEVAGQGVFQGHGMFLKQQMGIVGYGMRRFVSNLAANLGSAGTKLKFALFGHWHNANMCEFAGVTAFINPSLIGTQEYGFLQDGSINRPAQHAYVLDEHLGHTSTEVFYGEGPGYDGTYEVVV